AVEQRPLPFLACAHVGGVGFGTRVAEEAKAREVVVATPAGARVRLEERPRSGPERGGRIVWGPVLRHPRAARWTSARCSESTPRCRTHGRCPTPCSRRTVPRSPSCTGSRRTCRRGRAGRSRDHGR